MTTNNNCKINYLKDKKNIKYLPYQYYNKFNWISIPMINKIPFIKKWQTYTKTVHPTYINHNIGILTGKVNGITVLDIDTSDNGLQHWLEISNKYSKINTPIVETPKGGLHYYFKYNPRIPSLSKITVNCEKIGWDVRNDKAIIVAPPSTSPYYKKKYTWVISPEKTSLKDMPKWLEDYIKDHKKKLKSSEYYSVNCSLDTKKSV